MNRNKSTFLAVIMILAVVVGACGGGSTPVSETTPPATTADTGPTTAAPDVSTTESVPEAVKVRFTVGAANITPAFANFSSIPIAMGYWDEENVEVEIIPTEGANPAMQAVSAGQSEISYSATAPLFLLRQAGSPIIAVYNQLTKQIFYPAVLEDSPITSIEDFRGARVAVSSLAGGAVTYFEAQLREVGIDPSEVELIATGPGAPALAALQDGSVDALNLWDEQYARMEASEGVVFRFFHSEAMDRISFGGPFVTSEEFLASNRETVIGLLRGVAKGAVFALANPEAAVQIHWQVYPDSKPTGITESEALAEGAYALNARLQNIRVDDRPTDQQLYGYMTPEEVQAFLEFLVEQGELTAPEDAGAYYTNDLIAEVNDFDRSAIEQAATAWTP